MRWVGGTRVIAFRGSGRDKRSGRTVRFELYSFGLASGETGMLSVELPASATQATADAARAAVESLKIVDR